MVLLVVDKYITIEQLEGLEKNYIVGFSVVRGFYLHLQPFSISTTTQDIINTSSAFCQKTVQRS